MLRVWVSDRWRVGKGIWRWRAICDSIRFEISANIMNGYGQNHKVKQSVINVLELSASGIYIKQMHVFTPWSFPYMDLSP